MESESTDSFCLQLREEIFLLMTSNRRRCCVTHVQSFSRSSKIGLHTDTKWTLQRRWCLFKAGGARHPCVFTLWLPLITARRGDYQYLDINSPFLVPSSDQPLTAFAWFSLSDNDPDAPLENQSSRLISASQSVSWEAQTVTPPSAIANFMNWSSSWWLRELFSVKSLVFSFKAAVSESETRQDWANAEGRTRWAGRLIKVPSCSFSDSLSPELLSFPEPFAWMVLNTLLFYAVGNNWNENVVTGF